MISAYMGRVVRGTDRYGNFQVAPLNETCDPVRGAKLVILYQTADRIDLYPHKCVPYAIIREGKHVDLGRLVKDTGAINVLPQPAFGKAPPLMETRQ